MSIQISVGEWKMRNGQKAVVLGRQPSNCSYAWVGYFFKTDELTVSACWNDCGKYTTSRVEHFCDIVEPWVSPIAPGHNPDKLTVEQVGEGWWLPEWEVLEKVTESQRSNNLEFWHDDTQKWLTPRGSGKCAKICTYRTRLTRDELLALITPKKRLLRVEELPAVCWVGDKTSSPRLVHYRDYKQQGISYMATVDNPVGIEILAQLNIKWSSDLKTWHSFEVEDKE